MKYCLEHTHTYIDNWPLQSFSQYYGLASHTTHVGCINFIYVSGGIYSSKSIPNDRFLRKFFMAGLFTFRVFARNLFYLTNFVLMPNLEYKSWLYT